MFCAHRFAEQNSAGCPLTAESKAEQCARYKHLRVVLCKARKECEDGEPGDRNLQRPDAAISVGDPSCQPTANCGHQQRGRRQQSGLPARNAPCRDQRRNRKAEHLDVHRVQCPTADACAEYPFFAGSELRYPGKCPGFIGDGFHAGDCTTKQRS